MHASICACVHILRIYIAICASSCLLEMCACSIFVLYGYRYVSLHAICAYMHHLYHACTFCVSVCIYIIYYILYQYILIVHVALSLFIYVVVCVCAALCSYVRLYCCTYKYHTTYYVVCVAQKQVECSYW
jgi:hypothetical protein